MSRNGSGTYNLPAGNPVVTGTTISSSWANTTLSDIATALTQSIAYNGVTTPIANLPMGGYGHTGVADATALTMYASANQVENGTLNYLTSVAGTNTITATAPLSLAAYSAGQTFRFIAAGANTGATTLNLNSLGAKSIVKTDGSALSSGDIASGAAVVVMYDGTNFQLLTDSNGNTETVTNLTVTGTLTASGTITGTGFSTYLASPPAIGGTAPAAGAFTTLSSSSDATLHGLTVGQGAGSVSTNTAVGGIALNANTTGAYNTAVGYQSLNSNTTGITNVAVGFQSQYSNTVGTGNTSVGSQALKTNTASNNTAMGINALQLNTTGTPNDAFGSGALANNTTGVGNVAVGYQSLLSNNTGGYNVGVGTSSLTSNTTGAKNVAIGYTSLYSNTTGIENVGIGLQALYNNTIGIANTALGSYTLGAGAAGATTFSNCTAVGDGALYANTGSSNTAVGRNALANNTTGTPNDAFGYQALNSNTTGIANVAIGYNALSSNTTGSGNTCIGNAAGYTTTAITTGTYNTVIGVDAHTSSATADHQIVIGAGNVGQGNSYVSIGQGGTNYIYNQYTTNATWTKASDGRIKTNIQDLPIGLDFINELSVKSYNWKPNNEYPENIIGYSEENTQDTEAVMYGMIAQDVKAAMDKLGYEHFGGWNVREADGLQGLSNEMFVLPLINAVKELSAKIAVLEAKLEATNGTAA